MSVSVIVDPIVEVVSFLRHQMVEPVEEVLLQATFILVEYQGSGCVGQQD